MRSIVGDPFWALSRVARRGIVALLAGVALLVTAAAAIAAHPKKGSHFAGATSESPVNGFKAPVTFAVSANGTTLTKFAYSTFGCFGAGGFRPGIDYYTQPSAIVKAGTVKVAGSGHFSVTGAVFVYSSHGVTTTTTTKVTGAFASSRAASGTITFTQKDTGTFTSNCGPAKIQFTVRGH